MSQLTAAVWLEPSRSSTENVNTLPRHCLETEAGSSNRPVAALDRGAWSEAGKPFQDVPTIAPRSVTAVPPAVRPNWNRKLGADDHRRYAFRQKLRRGHYELADDVPLGEPIAAAFTVFARAI
jgi:hypothetical protein